MCNYYVVLCYVIIVGRGKYIKAFMLYVYVQQCDIGYGVTLCYRILLKEGGRPSLILLPEGEERSLCLLTFYEY